MLKRLIVGMIKGIVLGGAIGAGLHFGLGWTSVGGLLAYLLAMASGATAGILVGKPPWRQAAWIESVLKGVAGIGVGALLYWVATQWGDFAVPMDLPGVAAGTLWTTVPLLVSTVISGAFGTLIELDNTGDGGDVQRGGKVKARVAGSIEEAEVLASDVGERTKSR